jgi:hypothetical protein
LIYDYNFEIQNIRFVDDFPAGGDNESAEGNADDEATCDSEDATDIGS